MKRMQFTLVYADAEGVGHEFNYTCYGRNINSGMRQAARWGTRRGELPRGWDLIEIKWGTIK